ncbi:MAG: MFS transporter [Anaerolineae bacterium]|nr:MFS transporter [Anaerolineae bacterium]
MDNTTSAEFVSSPGLRERVARQVLPLSALTAQPVAARFLRIFWFDGLFISISQAFTQTFIPLYLLAFGATASDVGMMGALHHLIAPPMFLYGSHLAERWRRDKALVLIFDHGLGSAILLVYVAIPFLFGGREAIWAIILVTMVRGIFTRLGAPSATAMIGHIVPARVLGRYMGWRTLGMSVASFLFQPVAGVLIAALAFPLGYQASFTFAFLVALVALYLYSLLPEIPRPQPQPGAAARGESILATLRADRNLLAFSLSGLVMSATMHLANPFYSVYMVRQMHLSERTIGLLAAVTTLASLVGLRVMGALSDRQGHKRAIILSSLGLALVSPLWFLVRSPWHIVPLNVLFGFCEASIMMALNNLNLAIAPEEQRARYRAIFMAITTSVGAFMPLVAGRVFDLYGFSPNLITSSLGYLLYALLVARFVRGAVGRRG